MTQLSNLIEQLKAAEQNKSGMFEIGEDTICALMERLLAVEVLEPVYISEDGHQAIVSLLNNEFSICGRYVTLSRSSGEPVEKRYPVYLSPPAPVAQPVAVPICPKCGDTGMADSGGVQPWGEPIEIPCDCRFSPQPVVVHDDKQLRALFDAWFASDCSFDRSPDATEEDNIAWRESYWYVWQCCRFAIQPSSPTLQLPQWIPCSERMPEKDGNYWGWWSECKQQGPVWFTKTDSYSYFQSSEITHWMPLPAAPQEPTK